MIKANIEKAEGFVWLRCGRCTHRLMKLISYDKNTKIEIKCKSCKAVNAYNINI